MNDKDKKPVGRPKVIGGSVRQIITTPEEFEEIKKLLKSIRSKK